MVGSGIFLLPSALASYGGISLIGWICAAGGAFLMAKVFARLSVLVPQADGGPYAFSRAGFGDFAGFLVAWGYWISIWCTNAAIAVSLVSALSAFFPALNGHPFTSALTALAAIWTLTWVNTRGIRASGSLQLLTTILKLLPLVSVALVGLFFIQAAHFRPFNLSGQSNFSAISSTAAMTLYAFLGLECATIPAGSVINPSRTIPKATLIGTLFTSAIYILGTVSVLGAVDPKALQRSVTPFGDAAVRIWGPAARYWVSAGVAVAAFGALNGWILIQGQIPYAIAKDKLFPRIFARENKQGTPALGIVISSVLVTVFTLMNYSRGLVQQFRFLVLLSTLTSLVPYLFSMAAFIVVCLQQRAQVKINWPSSIVLSVLSFGFAFWAIAGAGQEIVYWGFLLLMAGVPLYVWVLRNRMQNP